MASLKRKMQRDKQKIEQAGGGSTPVDVLENPQGADEATVRQVESMAAGLTKLVHSKETREDIMKVLQSGDPAETIPMASQMVFSQIDNAKIPGEVRLSSFVILVTDLIELGNATGTFEIPQTEEAVAPVLQASLQNYIEYGVKEGLIDPVELQQQVEPLMPEKQRAAGLKVGQALGVPAQAGSQQAMIKTHEDAMRPLAKENADLKGMLAQVQGPQQGGM